MTYDFNITVENITPAQAQALFDALVLLLAPYPDSTAGYHETREDDAPFTEKEADYIIDGLNLLSDDEKEMRRSAMDDGDSTVDHTRAIHDIERLITTVKAGQHG